MQDFGKECLAPLALVALLYLVLTGNNEFSTGSGAKKGSFAQFPHSFPQVCGFLAHGKKGGKATEKRARRRDFLRMNVRAKQAGARMRGND